MLRPRTRFTIRVIFGSLAAVAAPGGARAQTPAPSEAEAIRVDYRADPRCPSSEEFRKRVFSRTRSARPALTGETARTFVVAITSDAAGFRGSLSIREEAGLTVARTVADAGCEEVAEALALSTVLAIDPSPVAAGTATAEKGEGDSNSKAGPEADAAKADATRAADSKGPAAANAAEARVAKEDEPATSPENPWSFAVFLGADMRSASSPGLSWGGSGAVELRPPRGGALGSVGALVSYFSSFAEPVANASASFHLLVARPSACVFPLRLTNAVAVMPCAAAELGLITGQGADITTPQSERRFWGALLLPLRLELDFAKSWSVQAEASLVVPLTRYRFVFLEPKTSVYEVPPVGFAAGLRIGARL